MACPLFIGQTSMPFVFCFLYSLFNLNNEIKNGSNLAIELVNYLHSNIGLIGATIPIIWLISYIGWYLIKECWMIGKKVAEEIESESIAIRLWLSVYSRSVLWLLCEFKWVILVFYTWIPIIWTILFREAFFIITNRIASEFYWRLGIVVRNRIV